MSTHPRPARRFDGAMFGNALAIMSLLATAVLLTRWQVEPLQWQDPGRARWVGAGIVGLLWIAFTGLIALGRRSAKTAYAHPVDISGTADWTVVHASQTGHAEQLALMSAEALQASGQSVQVVALGQLRSDSLMQAGQALFIVSTTGEGDAPDPALPFVRRFMQAPTVLGSMRYGVLALGDREYDAYCAFGHRVERWLRQSHAHPLFDLIEVDNGDPGALRLWQQHLGQLSGHTDLPDWNRPRYQAWRLTRREHLNAGSPGGPAFLVALEPDDPAHLDWVAGDIAEVGPRNPPSDVDDWLERAGLEGDSHVHAGGGSPSLRKILERSRLPDPATLDASATVQALADGLQALPHREYSIASTPTEGELRLLVRQMQHPDGRLGSGSGWLTRHAPAHALIDLRIRRNTAFHPPGDDRPLVLIGNGTGLAGLRALLKTRMERGHHRNWLLFGERTRAHDLHFGSELQAWHAAGQLERLDLVFSRDDGALRYVQDAVSDQAGRLRQWVADGAAFYVCGSLAGMAPGVDAALRSCLGDDEVDALVESGRYRRDVY